MHTTECLPFVGVANKKSIGGPDFAVYGWVNQRSNAQSKNDLEMSKIIKKVIKYFFPSAKFWLKNHNNCRTDLYKNTGYLKGAHWHQERVALHTGYLIRKYHTLQTGSKVKKRGEHTFLDTFGVTEMNLVMIFNPFAFWKTKSSIKRWETKHYILNLGFLPLLHYDLWKNH